MFPCSCYVIKIFYENLIKESKEKRIFYYSKEPKSVTTFNSFTFFRTVIIQLKVEDSFQLLFDWILTAQKNANKLKVRSHFWPPCSEKHKHGVTICSLFYSPLILFGSDGNYYFSRTDTNNRTV